MKTSIGCLATALICISSAVLAQAWPTKPVRMIIPFEPGGGTDLQARLLAKKFSESMGQTFVADNRAGAGGMIGAETVAKATPDGYTVLFASSALALNAALHKSMSFDPVRNFAPVSLISTVPLLLVVNQAVPARSVAELIELAAKSPGKLNASSSGSGTASHISIEMLNTYAKIQITHVPYKGQGPATTALISKEVDFGFPPPIAARPFINSKQLRALAVTTGRRASAFPDLPTVSETVPGFEAANWYGLFFPAGTPAAIIDRLNSEGRKALASADISEFFKKDGTDAVGSSQAELAAYLKREISKYTEIVRLAGIKSE